MKYYKKFVGPIILVLLGFSVVTFAQDDGDALLDDLLMDNSDANTNAVEVESEQIIPDASLDDLLDDMGSDKAPEQGENIESSKTEAVDVESKNAEPVAPESGSDAGLTAEQLEQQRIVELQAAESEGKNKLKEAADLIEKRRYSKALAALRSGISKIPQRPANDAMLEEARRKIVEVQLEMARQSLELKDYEKARTQVSDMTTSLEAVSLEFASNIQKQIDRISEVADKQEHVFERANTPEALQIKGIKQEEDTIDGLIDSGKRVMAMGKYNEAEQYFKRALNIDVYNKDAMRLLRKVDEDRYRISTLERGVTVKKMMQDVRESWNPPIKLEIEAPTGVIRGNESYAKTETQELRRKMDAIVIPSIEFRQANIVDVIDFLREASAVADSEGFGVNIISKIPQNRMGAGVQQEASPTETFGQSDDAADTWANFDFDEPQPAGGRASGQTEATLASSIPTITLNLKRVTLMDAIKYVTEVAGLKYRLEKNVVIITPADAVEGQVITRMYPVQPSFLDVIIVRSENQQNRQGGGGGGQFIEMGDSSTTMEKSDVKEFFINSGVKFPTGTSISYNKGISQLIVSNTPENLEVFESILSRLNVIPNQVEIETRFVEVAQNDLEEMGFEWLLNDNYEMLVKDGSGPVGGRERVVMNANRATGGFTSGLRFFSESESGLQPTSATVGAHAGLGSLLGISSVLTNPQVSMILHALDRKGGSDLLSAPRVTTRSGVNAEIKVVREIIYPSEFNNEVQNIETTDEEGRRINTRQIVVTPEGFETRETGVIMNVTPTVGPDGYTIDLSMVPEVTELVDWIQYGTDDYNMPQPVFSKRTVATSIIIWDGQTVVMGGMIREQITTVDDKIPFLGDIPLLGRLFRNKGEYSQKQNLLIFVTARLVDPAGNRIRKPGEQATPSQPNT